MTVRQAFVLALWGCAAGLLLAVALTVAARAQRGRHRRHRERAVARWRPVLLSWTDDRIEATDIPAGGRDRHDLIEVAVHLLPKLRGADRDHVVGALHLVGMADTLARDARSRRSLLRLRAAIAMDACASPADVGALIVLLRDGDRQIRHVAARALGRIGDPRAVRPLMRGMTDRTLATHAVSMAIVRIGGGAVPALQAWLDHEDVRCRRTAAELLGHLGEDDAEAGLLSCLRDAEPSVRIAAAGALGRFGSPSSIGPILSQLHSELGTPTFAGREGRLCESVCVALLEALGLIGDRRAIPDLEAVFARSTRISAAAAEALVHMGARRPTTSTRGRDAAAVGRSVANG